MTGCPKSLCFVPETSCALGNINYRKCTYWQGNTSGAPASSTVDEKVPVPWSGYALGSSDINFIASREKPIIVAIAGPESAGKTTLLASWYLLMGRGKLLDAETKFNGSYSLAGWEAIAASLRWAPGQHPTFPAHTTSRDARTPGLLHLCLRRKKGRSRDFLFADAPGAWFQKWSVNADALEAEGARWLAIHADILLIVADCAALSGSKLGLARGNFQLLAKRIAAERKSRPVALVWTKADVSVANAMREVIRTAVLGEMGDAAEFETSVVANDGKECGRGLISLFEWITSTRRAGADSMRDHATTADPLFMFGKR